MKLGIATALILMTNFLTLPTFAKNSCACRAIPESKTYQGEARKRRLIGFDIDWSCDYQCKVNFTDEKESGQTVRAFYHEHFWSEDGNEGICEGMKYELIFSQYAGREIYSPTHEIRSILPAHSKSKNLIQWANQNNCE